MLPLLASPPLQRLREFWEEEVLGAGAPPSAAERDVAFAAWMDSCRLLEAEAALEVRTGAPHGPTVAPHHHLTIT